MSYVIKGQIQQTDEEVCCPVRTETVLVRTVQSISSVGKKLKQSSLRQQTCLLLQFLQTETFVLVSCNSFFQHVVYLCIIPIVWHWQSAKCWNLFQICEKLYRYFRRAATLFHSGRKVMPSTALHFEKLTKTLYGPFEKFTPPLPPPPPQINPRHITGR